MSIIRRGDFHKHVPSHVPHAGDTHGGLTFLELFIIVGIIATLTVSVYVAIATDRQVMQAQRVVRFIR